MHYVGFGADSSFSPLFASIASAWGGRCRLFCCSPCSNACSESKVGCGQAGGHGVKKNLKYSKALNCSLCSAMGGVRSPSHPIRVWFLRDLSPSRTTPLGTWDSASSLRWVGDICMLELWIRLFQVSRWGRCKICWTVHRQQAGGAGRRPSLDSTRNSWSHFSVASPLKWPSLDRKHCLGLPVHPQGQSSAA